MFSPSDKQLIPVIMAGGMGRRMNSNIPKVLHKIAEEPMLVRIIKTVIQIKPPKILIIVGKYRDIIKDELEKHIPRIMSTIVLIDQLEPQGTGHALQCALHEMNKFYYTNFIVLSGDVPLISIDMINNIYEQSNNHAVITTTRMENPLGYGRIIIKNNKFEKIVEEKDCSTSEKQIKLVNCGLYMFSDEVLREYLPQLTNNNAQGEYYLTDIFKMMIENGSYLIKTMNIQEDDQYKLQGVNTSEQLEQLTITYLEKRNITV